MKHSTEMEDVLAIWRAGVEAVTPSRLFADKIQLEEHVLRLDDRELDLAGVKRLVVVGAGKASAAMALALHEQILSTPAWRKLKIEVDGWINAPEGTFAVDADAGDVRLFAARPPGINQPTAAAVEGTGQILEKLGRCRPQDAVLCLLSGGGSALLVAPRAGVTLDDKQAVAREIAAAGGNIEQLNAVRRALSDVKGGGLARACRAGRMCTLIISDVLGDPLQTIASGPTVLAASDDPAAALRTLDELHLLNHPHLQNVRRCLEAEVRRPAAPAAVPAVEHIILGNNADAVDAAGVKAVELGYAYVMQSARQSEGDVADVAARTVAALEQLSSQSEVQCWISGGEPTVKLPAGEHGKGGRNQQLALGVLCELTRRGWPERSPLRNDLVLVSGGTDGEDGPTDAAGAVIEATCVERLRRLGIDPREHLRRADAYPLFERLGRLVRTGPTGTNVCDLRVALVGQSR